MSGGHFEYKQYNIEYIADEIEQLILTNNSDKLDQWRDKKGAFFTDATIAEFKKALLLMRQAQIYAQRIDWLCSGDDGEDTFHIRLKHDLEKL